MPIRLYNPHFSIFTTPVHDLLGLGAVCESADNDKKAAGQNPTAFLILVRITLIPYLL
jgi:hypothetical protein